MFCDWNPFRGLVIPSSIIQKDAKMYFYFSLYEFTMTRVKLCKRSLPTPLTHYTTAGLVVKRRFYLPGIKIIGINNKYWRNYELDVHRCLQNAGLSGVDAVCPCGAIDSTFWWVLWLVAAHYGDVIISTMESKITSLTIIYSTVCSGADQGEHQGSASLAFVKGIHRWPMNSPSQRASNTENISISWRHHGTETLVETMWNTIAPDASASYGNVSGN